MEHPVKIFISYSHKDDSLMEEFNEFLQPLVFSGQIEIWNDKAINAGDLWDDDIKNALKAADIVLLLLSPSFLASTYINRVEIAEAFEQQKSGKKIIPVMLRPCLIDSHIVPGYEYKIADFQGAPKGRKAVILWENHEEAWMDIVKGLMRII